MPATHTHTHTPTSSSFHRSASPHPRRVVHGAKGHPGDLRREINMWSGIHSIWKRRLLARLPTRRVQSHFGSWLVPFWLASRHSDSSGSSSGRHHTPDEMCQGPPGSWRLAPSDRYRASNWNTVTPWLQLSLTWKSKEPGNSHNITGRLPV